EIWGRTCASLYADPTSFAQAIHPEDKERIFQAIQKQYQGIFFNEEYRIIRPDGSLRWVWGRTFPIENDQGKVYRVLAVVEDITRRKQMEAELIQARDAAEAANRAKSAFLANMSHELRTPLNAILGFAQLTVHNPSLPPEHRDNLHIITTSGEHLLTLINQVLDLSKIEAGKMSLEEKEFDLYRLLDDLEGLFQLRAADKSLRLMFDRAADVPQYIRTDEVKLRQVLINLLNNAVKFTQRGEVILRVGIRNQGSGIGGKIKKTKKEAGEVGLVQGAESLAEGDGIGNGTTDFGQTELPAGQHPESAHKPDTEDWPDAQRPDNQPIQKPTQKSKTSPLIPNAQPLIPDSQSLIPISFQIQDTGPGIAPAELDYLFEAFSQTQAGLQAREGTGLGLAISRRFVQLLGGEIWVESQVGQGATFTFTLPVGVAAGAEVLARAERLLRRVVGVAPGQPVYRLLIVDDRWDNRQFLVKLLAPFGFELQEAENGQQALEIWQAWQPHLIWLDIRMPVLDGWETTRRIKATPQGQKTVVVALTAGAFKEDRARVLAAGCDGFIRKPLREADIFETLERHLGLTFIYAEPPVEATPRSKAELVAALKTLPPDWLAALEKAIIVVDMERIDHLLAQIRGSRPALAHRLTKLADNFEFNRISALIEAAKKTE
ncbi:MAG: response regulator, partial [Anaerolineae bacterium]|nr:response regulator [Anaerolineae bacterium]